MRFKTLLAVFGFLGLVAFLPPATAALQRDLHYQLIDPPQTTDAPAGKIEVIEFFSYACPHCYQFEPTIDPWIKKLPKDVYFYRVPLAGGAWGPSAKLFYTLQAMGIEDKYHDAVFAAIHGDKTMNAGDDASIQQWAAKQGIDAKKFADTYKSFAVASKVQRAMQMAASHKIDGVPTIVVDGRYVVLKNTIQSFDDLTALTDQIIAMARAKK